MKGSGVFSPPEDITAFHELQEIGRKITILGRLLAESPTDIWMSSDELFTEKRRGNKHKLF